MSSNKPALALSIDSDLESILSSSPSSPFSSHALSMSTPESLSSSSSSSGVSKEITALIALNQSYFTVQRLFREIFELAKAFEALDLASIREKLNEVLAICALYQKKSTRDDLMEVGGGEVLFSLHNLNNDAHSLLVAGGVLDSLGEISALLEIGPARLAEQDQLRRAISIKTDLSQENLMLSDLVKAETEKAKAGARQEFELNIHSSTRLKIDDEKRAILLDSLRVLLDNAVKYGQKDMSIKVDANYRDGSFQLSVSNGGRLSDPEGLFRSGDRADAEASSGGWGFGLIRAKELLEGSGSSLTIAVDDLSGRVIFSICLNLPEIERETDLLSDRSGRSVVSGSSVSASSQADSEGFSEDLARPIKAVGPIKALVVDDGAELRIYQRAGSRLDKKEIALFYASNAEAALDIFSENPDLSWVCSDQTMPGMSGLELAQELRARGFKGQAYLCSGDDMRDAGGKLPDGVDHCFLKPGTSTIKNFVDFYNGSLPASRQAIESTAKSTAKSIGGERLAEMESSF